MRIDAYNKINQMQSVSKVNKVSNKGTVSQGTDKVEISQAGMDYQVAKQAVKEASDIRYDLVNDIDYSIKRISDLISDTSQYSSELEDLSSRINELYYDFEDICSTIREQRDNAVYDPAQLDSCIARIEVINKLKNKHDKNIEELLEYQQELASKLSNIENMDHIKSSLENILTFLHGN
jgi:negative regulator of flagellin synthesis FlgM